ncbi:MAG: anaerobic ribonucleoside-triphosphate reductase activating protein [Solobacterium sp.]|nr:anaerobic ribonucleoside-triphosphate reductase activating protein [Solobacterium sp.]
MENNSNFLIHLSILYRNMQKYFDRVLAKYEIGSGQLFYLFYIYENEGISMQETSRISEVDKGTTTKSINRLIEQGYVRAQTDENDHRVKRLYTTAKAAEIMNDLYELRNEYRNILANGVAFDAFEEMLAQACENSRTEIVEEENLSNIKIGGLQKLTLLDYPGKAAATIFTSGCNFKCPYCHNRDLVFVPDNYAYLNAEEVLEYLEKRKGVLDGVCISGGEPLLQEGLLDFIKQIKRLNYLVKIDTNGNHPERLKKLVDSGYVDYVAMDVKNSPDKYAATVGLNEDVFQLSHIKESISYLLTCDIDYEFRTTVVKEFHTKEDLIDIGRWIRGAKHYYLQQYVESGNVIQPGFSAYDKEEMEDLLEEVKALVPTAQLRGMKEG